MLSLHKIGRSAFTLWMSTMTCPTNNVECWLRGVLPNHFWLAGCCLPCQIGFGVRADPATFGLPSSGQWPVLHVLSRASSEGKHSELSASGMRAHS